MVRRTSGVLVVVACAAACGSGTREGGGSVSKEDAPRKVAAALCGAYFACGCDEVRTDFTSRESCELDLAANLQAVIDEGEQAGLEYDGACAGNIDSVTSALGCRSLGELVFDTAAAVTLESADSCKVYYGTEKEGARCAPLERSNGDDCDKGLECRGGTCRTAATASKKGKGEPCGQAAECGAGLACVELEVGGDKACRELPGPGGTCLGYLDLCDPGAYCRQSSKKCAALPGAGHACASSPSILLARCDAASVCEGDGCVAAPGDGEPCVAKCVEGFSCQSGTCRRAEPVVCATAALVGAG